MGLTDAALASIRGIHTVVEDLRAARAELLERGVDVSEVRHKSAREDWQGSCEPGLDRDRADYASFAAVTDPDGNQWVLQERGFRDWPGSACA